MWIGKSRGGAVAAPEAAPDWARLRHLMLERQVIGRGVRDARVLAAMRAVPRHEFVPAAERPQAYADRPLPIGFDQTISQPYIVALMTAALELAGNERVLEIGTGSGYQAAVLAEIVRAVDSLEIVPELAAIARENLARTGYREVTVHEGDGGNAAFEPFDAIVVTAAPEHVPPHLLTLLAPRGRLVLPVGSRDAQQLMRIRRGEHEFDREILSPVRFVPMTGCVREET